MTLHPFTLAKRARAIRMIQGTVVLATKLHDYFLSRIGFTVENDILPYLRKEASNGYLTYVDIGACQGDTVLPIAEKFESCLAIEPDPRNLVQLRVSLGRKRNCRIYGFALSQTESSADLFLGEEPDQSSLTRQGGLNKGAIRVPTTTLDIAIESAMVRPPYMIKIDIQGNELPALRGGERVLQDRCTVISEFWPFGMRSSGYEPLDLIDFMAGHNYQAYNLAGKKISRDKAARFAEIGKSVPGISTDLVFRKVKLECSLPSKLQPEISLLPWRLRSIDESSSVESVTPAINNAQ